MIPLASQSGNVFKGDADKNGWIQFPNGVIMQWMEIVSPYRSSSATGSANIGAYYFPIPFKEVCYNVSLTSECFIEGEAQLESTLFDKEKVNIRLN